MVPSAGSGIPGAPVERWAGFIGVLYFSKQQKKMSKKRFLVNVELLQKAFLYLESEFIFDVMEHAEAQATVSSVVLFYYLTFQSF